MNLDTELLTIQKFIYLLDDFHYTVLRDHLQDIRAALPLKLVQAIRKQLPLFDRHEQLCKKLYQAAGKTEKQNFNQLSSYTLKLTGNLANNYPEYLHPNIQKIQNLVLEGRLDEANFLTTQLIDIAERVNDFTSLVFCLKFQSQQAYMAKDFGKIQKIDQQLAEAVEAKRLLFKIQSVYRNTIYTAVNPKTDQELSELLRFFESFHQHRYASIRIFSRYALQHVKYVLTTELFSQQDTDIVNALRKELQNYPYVVFPFLMDISGSFENMLLSSPYTNVFAKESVKSFEALLTHYDSIKFWSNYNNISELNLIAIQGTRLLSLYHYKLHLSNYQEIIEPADKMLMKDLIEKCSIIITRITKRNNNSFEERSAIMLRGALMILSGGQKINEGLNELELLLINYQQINFKAATDSIFLCLIVGYFALKDYEKCNQTFKRYIKTIKGKLIYEGNDIKIHSYYYLSQWLSTNSKQYPAKLDSMLKEYAPNGSQRTIWELISYFDLPLKIPQQDPAAQ